jgi:hypothetical protein
MMMMEELANQDRITALLLHSLTKRIEELEKQVARHFFFGKKEIFLYPLQVIGFWA